MGGSPLVPPLPPVAEMAEIAVVGLVVVVVLLFLLLLLLLLSFSNLMELRGEAEEGDLNNKSKGHIVTSWQKNRGKLWVSQFADATQ